MNHMSLKIDGSLQGSPCECHSPQQGITLMDQMPDVPKSASCCGSGHDVDRSPLSAFERPGYAILPAVADFIDTPAGAIPRLKSRLALRDFLLNMGVRLNIKRDDYQIAPGLYAVGTPHAGSPVVVTANYKLSVDHLRESLSGRDAFILILDTRGVNVWCAAGKGTFGTAELIRRLRESGVEKVVSHRKLILPQLGASGVSAFRVKKETGFEILWGPVRAQDLGRFLDSGRRADKEMRTVRFGLWDRMILIPVELSLTLKPALMCALLLLVLSGIDQQGISFKALWERWPLSLLSIVMGILSGAVVTPAFLPYLHGVSFSMKGAMAGLLIGTSFPILFWGEEGIMGIVSLMLITCAISSYLAMNFTGATPFTSPSGVEKEMRRAIPLQLAALLAGIVLWVVAGF